MKNVIVSLVVGWFVFWVCLWVERAGSYARFSVDDLPGPVLFATVAGLASWAVITAWPRIRARFARRRALRERRATEPKRWKRLVGWYLALAGIFTVARALPPPVPASDSIVAGVCFLWGLWLIVSNPPEDGYLIARLWDSVRSAVHR